MAMNETDIKVIIAAELKKRGFDEAEKRTKSLTKSFKTLGAAVGIALSGRAIINFTKAGVQAFAEEEKSVKQLTNSLANLGFAFSVPAIERFLENTEKATLITKEELRPAIAQLISTTMSANKSMKLLNTALDISAQTGTDVSQVVIALTRAYNGNYTSLAKLSRGYTAGDLKAAGFEQTIDLLNQRFGGSAAANADTYAYKIGQLQKAFGDAQKEVGKGLIRAIEQLGSGDYDQGLQDLVDFGNDIGDAFGYAAGAVKTLTDFYNLVTLKGVRNLVPDRFTLTQQPEPRGGKVTPTQFELVKAAVERRKEAALRAKILADQKKLAAIQAKAERERAKREREALALKRAGTVFDMENIQIIAALQGEVDENQRLRLVALLALNTQNAEAAEKLSQALMVTQATALQNVGALVNAKGTIDTLIQDIIVAQAKIALAGTAINDIPKAKNPFSDWPNVLQSIIDGLGSIPAAPNPFQQWDDIIAGIQARIKAMKNDLESLGGTTSTGGTSSGTNQAKTLGTLLTTAQKDMFSYNLAIGLTNVAFQNSALTGDAFMTEFADQFEMFRQMIFQQLPNITVNVSGSVISEADLLAQINAAILQYQKNGQVIIWSPTP